MGFIPNSATIFDDNLSTVRNWESRCLHITCGRWDKTIYLYIVVSNSSFNIRYFFKETQTVNSNLIWMESTGFVFSNFKKACKPFKQYISGSNWCWIIAEKLVFSGLRTIIDSRYPHFLAKSLIGETTPRYSVADKVIWQFQVHSPFQSSFHHQHNLTLGFSFDLKKFRL
jgi:hypothetical protein